VLGDWADRGLSPHTRQPAVQIGLHSPASSIGWLGAPADLHHGLLALGPARKLRLERKDRGATAYACERPSLPQFNETR